MPCPIAAIPFTAAVFYHGLRGWASDGTNNIRCPHQGKEYSVPLTIIELEPLNG
jgi:hypothetical protein